MASFATIDDLTLLWRPLSAAEQTRAAALLEIVSDSLRGEADKVGKNLDDMVKASASLKTVAKSVTVDVVARTLMTSTDQEPLSQFSQTAGPFTASGTFLVPGGGIFIKRSELAWLGLRRQKVGALDLYGITSRSDDHSV